MDAERRIRFIIPPFFLVTSLIWGLVSNKTITLDLILGVKSTGLIAMLAGGGVMVLPIGYLLGTITIFVLRSFFFLKRNCWSGSESMYYEVPLSKPAYESICERIPQVDKLASRKNELFAGVTFDHDILKKKKVGVHKWIVRRWSAFNIAATSVTALIISLLTGWIFEIELKTEWWLPVLSLIVLFIYTAFVAWNEVKQMIKFQLDLLCDYSSPPQ